MDTSTSTPWLRRASIAFAIAFAVVLLTVALVGNRFDSPLAWAPGGLVAAAMLRWGGRSGFGAVAGTAAAGLLVGQAPFGMVLGALGASSGAVALAALLRRLGLDAGFRRRADVLRFVAATSLAMLVPSAVVVAAMFVLHWQPAMESPGRYLLCFWMNSSIAVLVLVPPLIAATPDLLRDWMRQPGTALALLVPTAAVVATLVWRTPAIAWAPLLGLPLVAAGVMRMDLSFAGLLTIAMSGASALGTTWAAQARGQTLTTGGTARICLFSLLLVAVMLIVRAMLTERDAAQRSLRDARVRGQQRLVDAAAHEQARIGRNVQQALGRDLDVLAARVKRLESKARRSAPTLADEVHEMALTCGRAIDSSRAISRGLAPPIEREGDLVGALRLLAEHVPPVAHLEISVEAEDGIALSAESERDLYRIVQEALNNALKHADARRVRITLARSPGGDIELVVADDGVGMATEARHGRDAPGLGLRSMQYRAEVAGGRLWVESIPHDGTRVTCRVPAERPCRPLPAHGAPLPDPALGDGATLPT